VRAGKEIAEMLKITRDAIRGEDLQRLLDQH